MKKLLAVALLLNAVLLADRFWRALQVSALERQLASVNGDINGDGGRDIADAISLLDWLFQGGPEPVTFEPHPDAGAVPVTGQTTCYDLTGTEIPCASAVSGQDGLYQAGCSGERFVVDRAGTVTDNCTGLMWQQATADINGNGEVGAGDSIYWREALEYCERLNFAGYDDWRLPNVKELHSILDLGRTGPAIDSIFDSTVSAYWSSTSCVDVAELAWGVDFFFGYVNTVDKLSQRRPVRAVRGGL